MIICFRTSSFALGPALVRSTFPPTGISPDDESWMSSTMKWLKHTGKLLFLKIACFHFNDYIPLGIRKSFSSEIVYTMPLQVKLYISTFGLTIMCALYRPMHRNTALISTTTTSLCGTLFVAHYQLGLLVRNIWSYKAL